MRALVLFFYKRYFCEHILEASRDPYALNNFLASMNAGENVTSFLSGFKKAGRSNYIAQS
jgi:hypothetical protein